MAITGRQFEIIGAAGKILTKSGVSGLTIKNLALEMQFSESAIYRHFPCKEDIIIALLEYLSESMDVRYGEAISREQSPEDKFVSLFRNQCLFFKENPHFVVAVFSDGLMEESKRINQVILRIMGVMMKHLTPIIQEGQRQNVFTSSISSQEMIHIIMGTFRLQMFKWRIADFQFDIVKSRDNMIQSLLKLIKSK